MKTKTKIIITGILIFILSLGGFVLGTGSFSGNGVTIENENMSIVGGLKTNSTNIVEFINPTDHQYVYSKTETSGKSASFRTVSPTQEWYFGGWENNGFRIRDNANGINAIIIENGTGYIRPYNDQFTIRGTNNAAVLNIDAEGDSTDDSLIIFKKNGTKRFDIRYDEGSKELEWENATTTLMWLKDSGTLNLASFTAVGADPVCWDGSGASAIGDCSSLSKYKENINYLNPSYTWLTSKYELLKPASYTWKQEFANQNGENNSMYSQTEYGLLADEVASVHSALVGYDEQGQVKNVRWFNLITFNVLAIKTIIEKQNEQEVRIDSIETTLCNIGQIQHC